MPNPNRLELLADLAREDPVFALLLHEQAADAAPEIDLTLEIIIRHYAGALDYGETRSVERLLTRSQEGRNLARDTRRILDNLKAMPLGEVHASALSGAPGAEIARIWLSVTQEHVDATALLFQNSEANALLGS